MTREAPKPVPRIPSATYRIQFNHTFTFRQGTEITGYLHDLGISDLYASPYLKATPKSMHGYDVVDPTQLNPEVGTGEEHEALCRSLSRLGMGHLLDIVPNHMGIGCSDNLWWQDILESGPASRYAKFFDINWNPVKKELTNRVLLPVLGDQYGNILDRGELRLEFDNGSFHLSYWGRRFPLRPLKYREILDLRLEKLEDALGADHPDVAEYISIITAIAHLPLYWMLDPQLVEERTRETRVIKLRLARLCEASDVIRRFIDENVAIFNGTPGDGSSMNLLDRLVSEQIYRLAHWRVATEEINYRRFFDINELAAVRVEHADVFRDTHRLVFELIRDGKVTGLRVDHPDGLYNPVEYFERLQQGCYRRLLMRESEDTEASASAEGYRQILQKDPAYKPFYVIVEKILMRNEKLPSEWPVFSTTGYSFANLLNGLFVDVDNHRLFYDVYSSFIDERLHYPDVVYSNKKLIMQSMASEINMLGSYLSRIAEKSRYTRDFTLNSLTTAISEVIADFPVYRTYVSPEGVMDTDRRHIREAVAKAKRRNPTLSETIFDFLRSVLLLEYPPHLPPEHHPDWLDFAMRFQQLTGPFMAKGLEDTAFYVYNCLISLNEVGGSPDSFGTTLPQFHKEMERQYREWPHSMNATSTHDTKRGEDVRARINVLSEMPHQWDERLRRWREWNRPKKMMVNGTEAPSANEEYFLYQTMIGFSPVGPTEPEEFALFLQRLKDYMLKSLREAKVNTSWINQNDEYEQAVLEFVDRIVARESTNAFLYDFEEFLRGIEPCGLFSSLSQTVLKMACPGYPDFYQGNELWNFTLVDPDNRRPVDYTRRRTLLQGLKDQEKRDGTLELARELLTSYRDGRIKMYCIMRMLQYRREHALFFRQASYIPLEGAGEQARSVVAFMRRTPDHSVITIVPRFLSRILDIPEALPVGDMWSNTFLAVDCGSRGCRYRNIFTGEIIHPVSLEKGDVLYLSDVFAEFPAAVLEQIH